MPYALFNRYIASPYPVYRLIILKMYFCIVCYSFSHRPLADLCKSVVPTPIIILERKVQVFKSGFVSVNRGNRIHLIFLESS